MSPSSTPLNVSSMLMAALAVVVIVVLVKKRYDTNIGLIFYLALVIFTSTTDREINSYLMYTGLALALLLRFEFLNPFFTKLVAWLEIIALVAIIWIFLVEVFGPGLAPF